ncbi:SpoIIE family protein phosphatase [Geodermatophilus sp. SYSU D00804]
MTDHGGADADATRRAPADGPGPDDEERLARTVGDAGVVRTAFDQVPLILAVYAGPEHTVVATNAAMRSFFGRDELIGAPIRSALPELAGQHVFELLDEVYATGRSRVAREWRLQVDLGGTGELQEVWLDFHLAPTRAVDGRVSGVATYAYDVTESVRARQAAQQQAADAERRARDARDVVTALQEALLPTDLPVLPGARIAARYLVADRDQVAGGDWFDAIPLPGGGVALVVGDVVGHGVAASAAMGQLRAVLSDALVTGAGPARALARADAFAARSPRLRATTVGLVVLDPDTGDLAYACCGQPPPVVVAPDGSTRFLADLGGEPLGTGVPGTAPALSRDTLAPGELVLLYSDGLVERPHRSIADGMAELAKVAADAATGQAPLGAGAGPAERVCQLTVELLTRTGYDDDVTTLAAHRLPEPVPPLHAETTTDRGGIRGLRRTVDTWLDELDPADDDRDAVELAVWEAIANAVDHAYPPGLPGPVRVDAALLPDGVLECRVTDEGSWRDPDPGATHRGRGLLMAQQLTDSLHVLRGAGPAGAGTVVTLRHRLHRPAMLGSGVGRDAAPAARPPFAVDVASGDGVPGDGVLVGEAPGGGDGGPASRDVRLRVSGPVDVTSVEALARQLAAASRGGVLPLTVDLSEVTLLASAGVQVLHRVRDQLAGHGHALTLVAPPGSAARAVLDLVHLPATG